MSEAYVYAALRDDGLIKIGYSISTERRLPFLRCRGHKGARYIHTHKAPVGEAYGIEQLAHRIAAASHVEKEVFNLTPEAAVELIDNAASRYAAGDGAAMLPRLANRPKKGRPSLGVKATNIRLPEGVPERIDALVGKNRRAEFIRYAVEKVLAADGAFCVARRSLTPPVSLGDIDLSPSSQPRVDGKRRWSAPTVI